MPVDTPGDSHARDLRVLVVDDEPLARQRLGKLLEKDSDVREIFEAVNAEEAIETIRTTREDNRPVDIVFLDVHMPGRSGLDVVREVGPSAMPVTVFVTAYDQHALAAFQLAALDYLLKPFENERFLETLARAKEFVRLRDVDRIHDRLRSLLQGGLSATAPPGADGPADRPDYLERIAVEMRGRVRVVPVDTIDYLTAEGNYVRIHAGEESFVINDTMQSLDERLNPSSFLRIHRSTIVRLDRIESLLTSPGGDYAVQLHDGTRLKVARSRRDELAERIGIA